MADCLPQEVLSSILAYLPLSDKLQCNLVCKQWRWAFLNPQIHSNSQILFDQDDDLIEGLDAGGLLESNVTSGVKSLCLRNLTVSLFSLRPPCSWASLLSKLTSLTLDNVSVVTEAELVLLLKQTDSLTALAIRNARDLFISGCLLANKDDCAEVRSSLRRVNSLDLSYNSPYLTDQLFNRIVSCMANVTSLSLRGDKILSHAGIYKKHYPGTVEEFNSPSVLTLKNILRFLSDRASLIASIDLYCSNLSTTGLEEIGGIKGLILKHVNVGKCTDISQASLLKFVQHQPYLETLNIDLCRKILVDNPAQCVSLFQALSANLRELSMIGLSAPKGMQACFEQLDQLEALNASECDIPSSHVVQGLIANKGLTCHLRALKMNSFGISSPEFIINLAPCLISLTHLELKNAHEGLDDGALQAVAKHCSNLEVLIISNCSRLTDLGFVSSDVTSLAKAQFSDDKIFLGSRAEAELREEIRRHEHLSSNLTDCKSVQSGFRQLKKLLHLELQNLKITELTLVHGLAIDDLRAINLNLCTSVGEAGFLHLAANNPHLEVFSAKQCRLTSDALAQFSQSCKRLKTFDVEGCQEITNDGIDLLVRSCTSLRHIDVSFCKKVKPATVENWAKNASLKTIGNRGLAIFELLEDE